MRTLTLLLICLSIYAVGQQKPQHIDPPFWWVNMPVSDLQIMLHGNEIGKLTPTFSYEGVSLISATPLENPNYLVLNLKLSEQVNPGSFQIQLKDGKKTRFAFEYELKARSGDTNRNQGFNSSDVIYLLMPDRFANGNPANDEIPGMLEGVDRSNPDGRHGGDIKGVADQLDYIKELGMTAVWLTPTFENDMTPEYHGYHGYAATDLYKVDRRFGTNEDFKAFVEQCHSMDMKVIMDMIHNHIGDQHWWMKDLPTSDWVHDFEKYGTTSFRGAVQSDPYASQYDTDKLIKGWFVPELVDLDQRNPVLARYLIQNSIWWVEYSGVDGIRMDTYVYPYKDYLKQWVTEVLDAYPSFNIVGESWVEKVAHEAYWQEDKPGENDGYDSRLPSVTDFQVCFATEQALKEEFSWTDGLMKLYYVLSQDRLYSDPMKNVIFLDNHDTDRFFDRVNKDPELFKMGYGYIMTTRGIPQVYYGTELMIANTENVDGWGKKRPDMPGGWAEDARSVFKKEGRTPSEQEAFEYVKKLTNWRKSSTPVHEGKLTHFIPEDNTYVFFRHTENEAVMVVMNRNEEAKSINRERFAEFLDNYKTGLNVVTGETINLSTNFEVGSKQTAIFELKN